MRASFTKMHGLGNDFVVLDAREAALPAITPAFARAVADRHTGIGCDQLILLERSATADLRMRIYNADGSEVGACGNASRAVALLHGSPAVIETAGGLIEVCPSEGGAAVDMGEPRFGWDDVPLAYPMDTMALPVGWDELERPVAVNVGNPHAVFFVRDADKVELDVLGPVIERDALFPERINVNVATVDSRSEIRLHVWERGAGLTRACGTGACATAVAAMRRGLVDRTVTVHLPGGSLQIDWGEDNHITMTGPATESFRGSFDWGAFA
ncbi:diaminopimelate epimerase [Altererythrobacter sp. B11]|uniref:diaminopimelate epimerase n=1 Tax=Altererythrobacter sp. B11 TaxID=2060312 RepID=UPI000DC73F49|nr:diaminopimelate epimerase [Altererythrobacter sp. B11]BBC73613.1 diaminopimelate epimerase [Altererythrobacter sp. B11]